MKTETVIITSPIGSLRVSANENGIKEVHFLKSDVPETKTENIILRNACRQLQEYFEGKRQRFDLPLAADGTDFQNQIWNELINIPYGTTVTYGDIAKRTHSVARAVGTANGSNPIAIIVPCHRVIGTNGKLTGYGGGLERKLWLLKHESGMLV